MGGDRQVVSLAGLHLLGDLADRVGLTASYSAAVPPAGERAPVHDRGRVLVHAAVALAGGGRCVADVAALRDQPGLFGDVASAPTIWRTLNGIDGGVLDALRAARAQARSVVWAAAGAPDRVVLDVGRVAGRDPFGEQGAGGVALQAGLRVPPDVLRAR